ncbi:L-lactate dehydrogenase (quinone) large subunit LdhH [Desulfovibrio litoralis]|uniref:Iron-sulfur cluster-binding protein n=1 Tax=Desulfovibrio litoralis DSM 11393 TaxID=1121455 RepID=A0A1M7TE86_9BACT|nr:LUD domain-containing protein [Desulfovibrio litoralis]SHN69059.1 iron-sulfur cluster-binding protein [Desulfovibrio litoralis DSM 11393]
MQTDIKNLKEYHKEIQESLDDQFLRKSMDNYAVAYRSARQALLQNVDIKEMIDDIIESKDKAIQDNAKLLKQFTEMAEKNGVKVHFAKNAKEANEIIAKIAKDNNCKTAIKSKSMTAEETLLNHALEEQGMKVTETDLGEWIIQLRKEGPSHMVMPAIHLSRYQVKDLFTNVTKKQQDSDIQKLVKVARRELREKFVGADMGISGANFAIAETGTIGLCTNEGNARLTTTLPKVHVALIGIEKLVPTLHEALQIVRILPKNATCQNITSYVTMITGANECATGPNGKKEMHIVFLDNGRSEMAKDPLFATVLRCVRCGACANVCPVYRLVGGHKMSYIYIGAIGLILTYFFNGADTAKNLVQNCINCEACKNVCAAGIDLPRVILEVRARILDETGHTFEGTLLNKVLKNRKLFHSLLRFAKWAQKPVTGGTPYLRHLPDLFMKGQGFKALPAIADKPFRDMWEEIRPQVKGTPSLKVAIFSGCVQDFVYPEQVKAAMEVIASKNVELFFPMDQTCCGLPVLTMGEKDAAFAVAEQNIKAFDDTQYDYIVTMCASCASHLKNNYPHICEKTKLAPKVNAFTSKVIDFSSLVHDVLGIKKESFNASSDTVAYHAPCHLCRGLDVHEAPRNMIKDSGASYVPTAEEEVCCGFGGSYSVKFPEISAANLERKLNQYEAAGATTLVTDCPGCVLQLRGGEVKRGNRIEVKHIAELLAKNLK